jgi:hypothetical protein
MHDIEPYDGWREVYRAEYDFRSPFYGREYDEFTCHNDIYGYYLHPQWDEFGSPTLYLKLLFADYERGYCIVELIGEWNDAVHNDILFLKRDFADHLIEQGIRKFILIGEQVLNAFPEEDDYYAEWMEDLAGGWIAGVNFQPHVMDELKNYKLDGYIHLSQELSSLNWRGKSPHILFDAISRLLSLRIG